MRNGKASATARLIARSTVLLSMEKKYSAVSDLTMARLSRMFTDEYSGNRDPLVILMKVGLIRRIILFLEQFVLRGIFLHYALRKKHIRLISQKSVEEGFNQLVVLGAGFDTLSFTLRDLFNGLKLFEFDFPATQAVKLNALRKSNYNKDRIEFFATDLKTSNIASFLDAASKNLRANEPTVIIAEGLLMYLSEEEVENLLKYLSDFFTHRLRLVFTFLETDKKGKPNFYKESSIVDAYLRLQGELFHWGLPHSKLPQFLDNNGYCSLEMFQPEDREKDMYGDETILHEKNQIGEMICVAERKTNGR
jgi:methyltransferase (TIGR00027 family)